METPTNKPRRSWTRGEEKQLLQHYLSGRNDASLKTDKGIKSKAWTLIVSRLAEKGIVADKDQCRSKYSRMKTAYDVFERLCSLSGAGWCSETNCPTLDDEGWSVLAEAQPRNAALFKRFRVEGFEHESVCALIAGDSRARAEDADAVNQFDVQSLLEEREGSGDASHDETPRSPAVANPVSSALAETRSKQTSTLFSPPSAAQRTDRVKRYRDGRKKAKEAASAATAAASSREDAKASLASFMKTAEAYFLMKMQIMARDMGTHDNDGGCTTPNV